MRWLEIATSLAKLSQGRSRHGCVVTRAGNILGSGYNKSRVHNVWVVWTDRSNCTTHAEANALARIPDARGATLYVARVNKNGKKVMSKPCDECDRIIKARGIKRVVYTT